MLEWLPKSGAHVTFESVANLIVPSVLSGAYSCFQSGSWWWPTSEQETAARNWRAVRHTVELGALNSACTEATPAFRRVDCAAFELPKATTVWLAVYCVLGHQVANPVAGSYMVAGATR